MLQCKDFSVQYTSRERPEYNIRNQRKTKKDSSRRSCPQRVLINFLKLPRITHKQLHFFASRIWIPENSLLRS
ncbi:hypothetical protein I7I48_05183 [Histoplasma ohiense]|nr:hypothetical protein I7I48_05183 [Histoplasma ohiense (nom. inval.)]